MLHASQCSECNPSQLHRPLRTLLGPMSEPWSECLGIMNPWVVCISICLCFSLYMCLYVCLYVSLWVLVCLWLAMHVYMCLCVFLCACLCVSMCLCACLCCWGWCICLCDYVSENVFLCVCLCPCTIAAASLGLTFRGRDYESMCILQSPAWIDGTQLGTTW